MGCRREERQNIHMQCSQTHVTRGHCFIIIIIICYALFPCKALPEVVHLAAVFDKTRSKETEDTKIPHICVSALF